MAEVHTLMTGIAFGESPRWHEGRLWFSDWLAQEIIAVDTEGMSEVILRVPFPSVPMCFDFLPDGRALVVSTQENLLLRRDLDGSLVKYGDLGDVSTQGWNEVVVDGRGNAYVNGGPGVIALVTADGSTRQVADGIAFPNGMAVTEDNTTLIIAESHGKKLTAFDIGIGGSLSNRRIWADLHDGVPDGICIDAEGAVWYGDVPNKLCVRVREGGEVLETIELDRGCFACALGGADKRTLFMVAAEWHGFAGVATMAETRTGQVLTTTAPSPAIRHEGAAYSVLA